MTRVVTVRIGRQRPTEADRGRQRPDSCQPTESRQSPDRAPTESRQSPTEPDRPTARAQTSMYAIYPLSVCIRQTATSKIQLQPSLSSDPTRTWCGGKISQGVGHCTHGIGLPAATGHGARAIRYNICGTASMAPFRAIQLGCIRMGGYLPCSHSSSFSK